MDSKITSLFDPRLVHVMLDFETLATSPRAAPIDWGAQQFKIQKQATVTGPGGPMLPNFEAQVAMEDCIAYKAGLGTMIRAALEVDQATLQWWDQQDQAVRSRVFGGTEDLYKVVQRFYDWLTEISDGDRDRIFLWSNGEDFDIPILKNVTEIFMSYPLNFGHQGSYRTIALLDPSFKAAVTPLLGVQHIAIEDAKYQAQVIGAALRRIYKSFYNAGFLGMTRIDVDA